MPPSALQRTRTVEIPKIRADIDKGDLAMVGLVRHTGWNPLGLTRNHQVLAYAYEADGDTATLRICDPNWPGRDDVTITVGPAADLAIDHRNVVRAPDWADVRQVSYGVSASAILRKGAIGASTSSWTDRSHAALISAVLGDAHLAHDPDQIGPGNEGRRIAILQDLFLGLLREVRRRHEDPVLTTCQPGDEPRHVFWADGCARAYRFASPRNGISYWIGGGRVNVPKKSKPPSAVGRVRVMLCRTSSSSRNMDTTAASNSVGVRLISCDNSTCVRRSDRR